MDGGCWEYFRTFIGIPLLVLYHLWGVRALIWLQIGLRCGLFNPAAFQSQEVASEHVARMSIIPRPQIATPRASWRESLTQAVSQCSSLILCTAGRAGQLGAAWGCRCAEIRTLGEREGSSSGIILVSVKYTYLFAVVSQRSIWLIMGNLESIEKCRERQGGNSHNPTI